MTRKHFKAIADQIKSMPLDGDESMREHIANEMADAVRQFNSNFDRNRFIEACGVQMPPELVKDILQKGKLISEIITF